MTREKNVYRFVGIIHTSLSPKYDVDKKIEAYSIKQGRLKLFFILRSVNGLSKMEPKVLMSKIKELRVIEEKS